MNSTYLVLRVLHVLCAVLWVGAAVLSSLFLTPILRDLGPDGMTVMLALRKRGFPAYFAVIATVTVLSGFWLYWHFTAGFSPEVSRSHAGMVFGMGGVCGLAAFIVGGPILSVSLAKATRLTTEAAGLPEGRDKADKLSRAAALRQRAATAGQIVSILVIGATILMAIAQYV